MNERQALPNPNVLARGRTLWSERGTLWARRRELWSLVPPWLVGAVGVLLIYGALGTLHAFTMGMYGSGDEPRHVAYAIQLADGELPKVTDRLPSKKLFYSKPGTMAAAAHPPLYYWYVGPVLDNAPSKAAMVGRLRAARLMTVALGALALIYVLRIAMLLFPRNHDVALATMAVVGTLPAFVNINALVCNDALTVLMGCGAFHGAVRLLMLGVTPYRFMVAGLWMALAPYSKFTAVCVVGPALLLTFIALIWRGRGGWLRRVAVASALSLLVVGAIATVSGPFYLRNYRLYGDLSGANAFLPLFNRKPNGSTLSLLFSAKPWATFFTDLWVRLCGGISMTGAVKSLPSALVLLPLAGLVKIAIATRKRLGRWLREPAATAMLLAAVAYGVAMLAMFMYHAKGGSMNARYAFGAIWVPTMFLAAGMAATRSSALIEWSVASFVLLGVATTELYAQALRGGSGGDFALVRAMRKAGLAPAASVVAALLVIGAGMFLLNVALRRAHRQLGAADAEEAPPEAKVTAAS